MKKIVITGAPHSGKSTVIEALSEGGYPVIPEAAIKVIDSIQELIPNGALEWRRLYFESFQWLITQKQLELEAPFGNRLNHGRVFLDRGASDGKAFAAHFNTLVPEASLALMDLCSYDKVFILDLVTPFDPRTESGRNETEEDCRALDYLLELVYRREGYDVVRVPLMSVEERANFILENSSA